MAEEGLKFDLEGHLKKFKNRDYFTKFESQFKDFQHDIQLAVDDAQREIESPIYVGVVGHYSHGKSSLLNAMLFPPKSKELLPTGESIVTSLCTLIQFKSENNNHEFHEVNTSGSETYILEDDYQSKVSGKRTGAIRDLSHFRLVLGTDDLAGTVFEHMADKQVELFDTPGLGGPYWKDEEALQQWIKEFLLMIVCIKIDKINASTASVINPFLKQTSRPVIIGITFWDLWETAPGYGDIRDENNARDKTREEIKRFFPTLSDAVDDGRIFFISAKNCREEVPVSEEQKYLISENWNVDCLRQSLTYFISERKNILVSQRSKESYIEKNRRAGIVTNCRSLIGKFNSLQESLQIAIERDRPPAVDSGTEELLEKFEEFNEDIIRLYERIIEKIETTLSDALSAMPINGQWAKSFEDIREKISRQLHELLGGEMQEKIHRLGKRHIETPAARFIDNTPLSLDQQKKILDDIRTGISDFVSDLDRLKEIHVFAVPSGISDLTVNVIKGIWSGLKQLLISNPPLAIGIAVAWFISPFILKYIYDLLPFPVLAIIVLLLAVGTFSIFWSQFQSSLHKTAMEVKDKARKNNRIANIRQRIIDENLKRSLDDFQIMIKESIDSRLTPIINQSEDMFGEVKDIMNILKDEIKKIERECGELTRQGRM